MRATDLKNILPESFFFDKEIGDNLLIYNQMYNDKIVSRYYIDVNINEHEININDYQEKYISSDFFNATENLQWNFYLIFIRDTIDLELKRNIENEESYARKFIFNKVELEKYLKYEKSISSEDDDVVARWKQKLSSIDLQEVFSDENFSVAIPRFIDGKAKKAQELAPVDTKPDENEDFILNSISTIKLSDKYRKHPEVRNYNLRKVNLICGSNGVGKTSLLESIELAVTGNNNRNENVKDISGQVYAEYESNKGLYEDSTTKSLLKYKARDYFWYNKPYSRSNELHKSFSRYNFYNSDTAYKLSNSPNDADFTEYLTAIALGPEFGAIRKRLNVFQNRLSKHKRQFDSQLTSLKDDKINAEKKINSFKKVSDPDIIFENFISNAKKIKWKKNLPKTKEDRTEQFEEDYKELLSDLNTLVHSKIESEATLNKSIKDLNELKTKLNAIEKRKSEANELIDKKSVFLKEISNKKLFLEKAMNYYKDARSFKIQSIETDIQSLKDKIIKFENCNNQLSAIELGSILTNDNTIRIFKKSIDEKLSTKTKEKSRGIEQLNLLKSTLDNIKSIIAEIKYYGKEYVSNMKEIDSCPLCESPQSKSQLQQKIEKIYNDNDSSNKISVFNKNIFLLEKEIVGLSKSLEAINKYELVIKNLIPDYEDKKISEIDREYDKLLKENIDYKKKLEELEILFSFLKSNGYNKIEFEEIQLSINENFTDLNFSDKSKKSFEKELVSLNNIEKTSKNEIKVFKQNFESDRLEIQKLITDKFDSKKYINEIDYEINEYNSYLEFFKKSKLFIEIKLNELVIEVRHNIEHLYETFKSFKNELINYQELSLANNIIKKSTKEIEDINIKNKRIEGGLKIINEMLFNDSEEKVLSSFFDKNIKEIKNIFTSIHSPKEFVNLEIKGGKVTLYKKGVDLPVPITEISTGQRSALALSIFLALNKKLKKGPNVIMFDDPVTYTDDLNILSFFDYLRNLIINESRQVIFATASNKIAKLFEKKFSFLNEDFDKHLLSRDLD